MIVATYDLHQRHELHMQHLAAIGWTAPQQTRYHGDHEPDGDGDDTGYHAQARRNVPAEKAGRLRKLAVR